MTRIGYWMVWFLTRFLARVIFGLKIYGLEHVPMEGPLIVAANHKSYLDPPLAGISIPRMMHYFAKRELFENPLFRLIISSFNAIPVRRGTFDPTALGIVSDILKNGQAILMFPEGTRGRGADFLPPKPGIGMLAARTNAPVLPAFIYRTDVWKQAIFSRRGLRVYFGAVITSEEISRFPKDRDGYRMLAEEVMKRIRDLRSHVVEAEEKEKST